MIASLVVAAAIAAPPPAPGPRVQVKAPPPAAEVIGAQLAARDPPPPLAAAEAQRLYLRYLDSLGGSGDGSPRPPRRDPAAAPPSQSQFRAPR